MIRMSGWIRRSTVAPTFTFPFVSLHELMEQKRTAEDASRTVEENGWVSGLVKRRVANSTRKTNRVRDINKTSKTL
jgi:hypothetical protein